MKRFAASGLCGIAALVFVVSLVVFANVTGFDFVYDDHWTVEQNAALSRPIAPLLRDAFSGRAAAKGVPDATRPAMILSVWIDRRLFWRDPAGYHLHSLLSYGLVSVLASTALFAMARSRRVALVGGLFFAVAPVHAEVVASINYREDLIASTAVLAALTWLFAPRREPETWDGAVIAGAVWGYGLLGKESAVCLVPMAGAAALFGRHGRDWLRSRHKSIVTFSAVFALWAVWRATLRIHGLDDVPTAHYGPWERIAKTGRFLFRALLDGLLPLRSAPEHAPEPTTSPLWLLVLALLGALLVVAARRRVLRVPAMALGLSAAAALPMSPLLGPVNEYADRYSFLGVLGGAFFWGSVMDRAFRRVPAVAAVPCVAVALALLAWRARTAAAAWRTDLDVWTAAVASAPNSARAWTGLSRVKRFRGDLDGALRAADRAVVLNPRFLRARVTRAYVLIRRGALDEAHKEIEEIERLGGTGQRGMNRARHCVSLPPARAQACIDAASAISLPEDH